MAGILIECGDLGDGAAIALHREDEGEGADVHRHVDHHVDQHRLHAPRPAGGEPHQRKAHVGDGAVGHQALDVLLPDRGDGAQKHGEHREKREDLGPVAHRIAEGIEEDAGNERHRGHLGGAGEEGRHRRRRAFIDIGRPHVEGHGGDLEGEPGEDEDEAEEEADRHAAILHRGDQHVKAGGAGEAVGQRGAVEEEPRAQRAQHEILEAGLVGFHAVAVHGGEHVERERLQLEPHVERDQIARRNHHHHADHRERQQDRILEAHHAPAGEVILADQQHRGGREQDGDAGEAREAVIDEGAVEGLARRRGAHPDPERQPREHGRREPGEHGREPVLAGVDREDQRRHRIDGQGDFRGEDCHSGGDVARHGLFHPQCSAAAPACVPGSAPPSAPTAS